jgi:hypothetical protein
MPTLLKVGNKSGLISLPFPTAASIHIVGIFIFVCRNHYGSTLPQGKEMFLLLREERFRMRRIQ